MAKNMLNNERNEERRIAAKPLIRRPCRSRARSGQAARFAAAKPLSGTAANRHAAMPLRQCRISILYLYINI